MNVNEEVLRASIQTLFGMRPYDYQVRFIKDCLESDRVVCRACRQVGKSTALSVFSILFAASNPRTNTLIVAPTDEQAGLLFDKIKTLLFKIHERERVLDSITMRRALLLNGSEIKAMTTGDKGMTVRGHTAHLLILEEAAFIKEAVFNEVLRPVLLSTHGKLIEISTPFGKSGFFYSHCQDLKTFKHHHIPWKVAADEGHIRTEDVDEARKTTPSHEFMAEYEAEFVAAAKNYFDPECIKNCVLPDAKALDERDMLPESWKPPEGFYSLGIDIARAGEDSSVFTIIRNGNEDKAVPHEVVFTKEVMKNTIDAAVDYTLWLHERFGFARIFVDETGLGAGAADYLGRALNTPKFKTSIRPTYSTTYRPSDVVFGVTFTLKNKIDMFSHLKLLMERGMLKFPYDQKLVWQLNQFEYTTIEGSHNIKLHHPDVPGAHDDYVAALALACQGTRTRKSAVMWVGDSNEPFI